MEPLYQPRYVRESYQNIFLCLINAYLFPPGCTNLQLDYNVCVHVPGAVNTHGPTPQMPNLTSDCKKYHKVTDGENCPGIQKEAGGITLAQFRKWNPTVDAKCSNLWNGYYVCTGV